MKKIKFSSGFTLIEIMVVVMIFAILVAIAIPSYRHIMVKVYESNAQEEMRKIAVQLEAYRSKNLTYAGFIPENQHAPDHNTQKRRINLPYGSGTGSFNYQIYVVDGGDPNNLVLLDGVEAPGQRWNIVAVPNTSAKAALLPRARSFFMSSTGVESEAICPSDISQPTKSAIYARSGMC